MPQFSHAKLIQQILQEKRITNLRNEPDKVQLEIYRIALSKIRNGIEAYNPGDVPYDTLSNGLDVLNELSIVLVPMSLRDIGETFKIKETVLPVVESGLTAVSQAIKAHERAKKKREKERCKKKI